MVLGHWPLDWLLVIAPAGSWKAHRTVSLMSSCLAVRFNFHRASGCDIEKISWNKVNYMGRMDAVGNHTGRRLETITISRRLWPCIQFNSFYINIYSFFVLIFFIKNILFCSGLDLSWCLASIVSFCKNIWMAEWKKTMDSWNSETSKPILQ